MVNDCDPVLCDPVLCPSDQTVGYDFGGDFSSGATGLMQVKYTLSLAAQTDPLDLIYFVVQVAGAVSIV